MVSFGQHRGREFGNILYSFCNIGTSFQENKESLECFSVHFLSRRPLWTEFSILKIDETFQFLKKQKNGAEF
jgi:hypothetical protein